jgi:hypothetical protein
MVMPPTKLTFLPTPSRPAPDPADSQAKNQPDAERDAHCSQRLALHTVNGLVVEVREFLDAALDRHDRPLCGVNSIFDGVGSKGFEQPRLM